MESLKQGPTLTDAARDYYADELLEAAGEVGTSAVEAAIKCCLRESPFRPDISDIRKALGITQAQAGTVVASADTVESKQAWHELLDYLKRYAKSDEHGRYSFRRQMKLRLENGQPVLVQDAKGRNAVAYDELPMPPLAPRLEWCLEQIGGIARIKDCEDRYIEIVRKEFVAAWPLYTENYTRKLPARAADGEVSIADVLQIGAISRMAMPGGRA